MMWVIVALIATCVLTQSRVIGTRDSLATGELSAPIASQEGTEKERKIRALLEESESVLHGRATLGWRRYMAGALRAAPSRMPEGESLLVLVTRSYYDIAVVVMLWSVPDSARIEVFGFRPERYEDIDEFHANEASGGIHELVDGVVIFESSYPLSFAACELLSSAGRENLLRAEERDDCRRLMTGAFTVEIIHVDEMGFVAKNCISGWHERPFGGMEDILLGLVGMTVDQVRRLKGHLR